MFLNKRVASFEMNGLMTKDVSVGAQKEECMRAEAVCNFDMLLLI